jgi:formylglycine-generating enzyme required for sulfatase activity
MTNKKTNMDLGLLAPLIVLACSVFFGLLPPFRDDIHWTVARIQNTSASYKAYLRHWSSDGQHATEARRIEDERAWVAAKALDTIPALDEYLRHYPAGLHADMAKETVDAKQARLRSEAEVNERKKLAAIFAKAGTGAARQELAFQIPDLGLPLVWIEPGNFAMGSRNGDNDEQPVTQVRISRGFWLGKTEVTQAQWRRIMGTNPSRFSGDDLPVENVSWVDAMEFCRKLTERERAAGRLPEGYEYTLPTEAQWEYACRAGTTGDFAGTLDKMAWYYRNSEYIGLEHTHPVGQKTANAWDLCDMHGNVWEWCLDWNPRYSGGQATDPTGASRGDAHVIRGGSWKKDASGCRSARRGWVVPGKRDNDLGFRLALSFGSNQGGTR